MLTSIRIMRVYNAILLSGSVLLMACSGGSTITENKKVCRNYASTQMTNGGLIQTCNFNKASLLFSCFEGSRNIIDTEYHSVKDFVLESRTLGLVTAASKRTFGPIQTDYTYDASRLTSIRIDLSALGGTYYARIDHESYDSFNRPLSGTINSNIPGNCQGNAITFYYDETARTVTRDITQEESCNYYRSNVSVFDTDGNITQSTFGRDYTTEYTIQTTNEVCF